MLNTYEEFAGYVDEMGFLTLSQNAAGWPCLAGLTREERWFTRGPDDPWQWRVRIVEERRAAYAKLFCGMPGFVCREWYPFFLAARRGEASFEDAWEKGLMSVEAKRIYELFQSRQVLATHEIKRLGGFTGKSQGRYETAMTALQSGMFLTVSGMTRMTTPDGRPHSWPVAEYQKIESWAWPDALERSAKLSREEAAGSIEALILKKAPDTPKPFVRKLIGLGAACSRGA